MKTLLTTSCVVALALFGCSDDSDDDQDCDSIAAQISSVAMRDVELRDYEGADRTSNPCADPIPVTSGADYRPACEALRECLDDGSSLMSAN